MQTPLAGVAGWVHVTSFFISSTLFINKNRFVMNGFCQCCGVTACSFASSAVYAFICLLHFSFSNILYIPVCLSALCFIFLELLRFTQFKMNEWMNEWVNMCVCVCLHMCMHIFLCVHMSVHAYVCVHMHILKVRQQREMMMRKFLAS
jgi:hypothetical protein